MFALARWACLLALLPVGARQISTIDAPKGASQAIDLTLRDIRSGSAVHIGKGSSATLVVVFATWCRTCRSELPLLDSLRAALPAVGAHLVALNADEGPDARVLRWLSAHSVKFTVVRDTTGAAYRALGVVGVPEAYLVDAEGVVRWSHRGPLDAKLGELRRLVVRITKDTIQRLPS